MAFSRGTCLASIFAKGALAASARRVFSRLLGNVSKPNAKTPLLRGAKNFFKLRLALAIDSFNV